MFNSCSQYYFTFVLSYSPDCVDCQRLQARWETVGAQVKSRMNLARVNKAVGGAATADRFGITEVPSFILYVLLLVDFKYRTFLQIQIGKVVQVSNQKV